MNENDERLPFVRGGVFPDGTRLGEPIPGSRYLRGQCFRCGGLVRTSNPSPYNCCDDCGGVIHRKATPVLRGERDRAERRDEIL